MNARYKNTCFCNDKHNSQPKTLITKNGSLTEFLIEQTTVFF